MAAIQNSQSAHDGLLRAGLPLDKRGPLSDFFLLLSIDERTRPTRRSLVNPLASATHVWYSSFVTKTSQACANTQEVVMKSPARPRILLLNGTCLDVLQENQDWIRELDAEIVAEDSFRHVDEQRL